MTRQTICLLVLTVTATSCGKRDVDSANSRQLSAPQTLAHRSVAQLPEHTADLTDLRAATRLAFQRIGNDIVTENASETVRLVGNVIQISVATDSGDSRTPVRLRPRP